jgi:hypothetical protein
MVTTSAGAGCVSARILLGGLLLAVGVLPQIAMWLADMNVIRHLTDDVALANAKYAVEVPSTFRFALEARGGQGRARSARPCAIALCVRCVWYQWPTRGRFRRLTRVGAARPAPSEPGAREPTPQQALMPGRPGRAFGPRALAARCPAARICLR